MQKDDLQVHCVWDEYSTATCRLHSDFFGTEILFRLTSPTDEKQTISDSMIAAVNDVLSLSSEYQQEIKKLLFEHCEICFTDISYPHVDFRPDESNIEANRRVFAIYTQEDAFQNANLQGIEIYGENDILKHRYAEIVFYPTWEEEHGCSVVLQDGKPISVQDNGASVTQYEEQ